MAETFQTLGFKMPKVAVNSYGIKVYVGHKGEEDWGVQIPNNLLPKEYTSKCKQPYDLYLISEAEALTVAEKYTKIARRMNYNG